MQNTLNIFFDPYLLPGMQNLLRDKFLSSIRSSRRPEARPLRSPGRGCDPGKSKPDVTSICKIHGELQLNRR